MGIPIVSEKYILARLKAGREIDHSAYLMVPRPQKLRSSPTLKRSCFASLTLSCALTPRCSLRRTQRDIRRKEQ